MAFGTSVAVYFLIWWLCLFAVLPFGARSQVDEGEVEPGTEPGAPAKPMLLRRLLLNSVVAGIVFAIYWFITQTLGYSLDNIPSPFPQDQ